MRRKRPIEPVFAPCPDIVKIEFWRMPEGALLLPDEAERRYGNRLYRDAAQLGLKPIYTADLATMAALTLTDGRWSLAVTLPPPQ